MPKRNSSVNEASTSRSLPIDVVVPRGSKSRTAMASSEVSWRWDSVVPPARVVSTPRIFFFSLMRASGTQKKCSDSRASDRREVLWL